MKIKYVLVLERRSVESLVTGKCKGLERSLWCWSYWYSIISGSLSDAGSRVWSKIHVESLSRRQPSWCSPWTTLGSQQLKSLKSSSDKIKFQWPSKNARAGGSKRGQRLFLLPVRLCFGATFPCAVKFPPPMHVHIFHPAQAWLTQGEHNTLFGVSSCDINGNSLPGAQRIPFRIPESVSQPFLWRSCFVT